MTQLSTDRPRHESGSFTRARTEAARAVSVEQRRAARTVAGNSRDDADRDALLAMLGLAVPVTDDGLTLQSSLKRYVHAVADLVGVPAEGTTCEVTDTITAYLALTGHHGAQPGRDLMLVWSERQGWALSVETDPAETPVVLSRLGGELVPQPQEVADFVTRSMTHPGSTRTLAALPAAVDRARLAENMERCTARR